MNIHTVEAPQTEEHSAEALQAAVAALKRRIEDLTNTVPMWSRGASTTRHTQHVQFSNGARYGDGEHSVPAPDVPLSELCEMQFTAIKAYRQTIPGPVDLVWRVEPQIERNEETGRLSIYTRLCFEPSLLPIARGIYVHACIANTMDRL